MAADPARVLAWPDSGAVARPAPALAPDPIATRLAALSPDGLDLRAVAPLLGAPRPYGAHKQITAEGGAPVPARAVRSGWVGTTRIFADGRRQIQCLALPGEIIQPLAGYRAPAGLVALTPVTLVTLERSAATEPLGEAMKRSAALHEHYLLNQTARLGRQLAFERVGHLLLELRDRLLLSGCGGEREYPMPLTQEAIADVLGLTSVHVNRTLQVMRRDEMIRIGGGIVTLLNPAALARVADYSPPVALP